MVTPASALAIAAALALTSSACEGLVGSVEVIDPPQRPSASQGSLEDRAASRPNASGSPPANNAAPDSSSSLDPAPRLEPSPDAAGPIPTDAAPPAGLADAAPPPVPASLVAPEAPVELERVGEVGGSPRRGACDRGVVIGLRATANPNAGVFGERLTFIEPICGRVTLPSDTGPRVARDDTLLRWDEGDEFAGLPSTEVPDERVTWVLQPEALCPGATPALVGLSGEYDPVAPDTTDTAALRSVVLECAPLALDAEAVTVFAPEVGHQLIAPAAQFAADGQQPYRSSCPPGAVVTQILVHSGYWLDGFVLGCAALTVSSGLSRQL